MNLYVGNLSWNATEEDVINHFSEVGKVSSVKIINDRDTGKSRGFCFVEMENADKAIDVFNGADMMGRKLTVNEARPKPTRDSRSDSRRDYSYGR